MARRKQEQPQGDDQKNQDAAGTTDKSKTRKQKRRGSGEGTVYQRTDGRWVAELTLEDGKRKYYYGKTQAEAIQKLKQAQYEMKQGILATGPKQKLADHLTYWLEQVKKRKLRASTYVRYRSTMNIHIIPALGHLPLSKVTLRTIQQFYNKKLDEERQSPSSVLNMHKVLNQAFAYAVKERLISINPCTGVSLPTQEKRKVQPLTVEQAQHLLDSVQGTMLESFIALALVVGMRHGELLALRWQDIDLAQGKLFIHRNLTHDENYQLTVGDPKTTSSERALPLPQPIRERLLSHQARQQQVQLKAGSAWQNHDLVFCTRKGGYLRQHTVRLQFYRLLKQAGLPQIHVHDLRHSAATLLRSMGVDLKVIQQILGHSNLDITANIYSHVLPSMQEEAVEKMNKLFEKPS